MYDFIEKKTIELDDTQEKDLTRWLDSNIQQIGQDRSVFLERHKKYLFNWDDFVTYNRKGVWEQSSNLHMPLTAIMVKDYHSRLYNIFSNENTNFLSPRESSDTKYTQMMKKLRDWYLFDYVNEYKGIKGFTREVFFDCITVGFGIGFKDFFVKRVKRLDIDVNELKKEVQDISPQMEELNKQELETEEEAEEKTLKIKPYKESEKIINVYSGTRIRSLNFEDVYFPNFINESNDMDFPDFVAVETEMDISQLNELKINKDIVEKIKSELTGSNKIKSDDNSSNIKQLRNELSGYNDNAVAINYKFTCQYCFCKYDIDDDGIKEDMIITRTDKGTIININYLQRISPGLQRPIFKFDCFAKPRQSYSRGIPEFMYPLNEEMDQLHNMRIDYMSLQTCPFGTYRGSSSLKNEPIRIAPGKFIPVDETSDLKVLNFSANSTIIAGEEDRLWHYAERLAASSSIRQGVIPETVGPLRSTSGVVSMLKEMEKEFKVTVEQNACPWKKLEKMTLADLDRIDASIKMRVLGSEAKEITDKIFQSTGKNPLSINAMFDIKMDIASAVRNDEVRRNEADILLNKLAAPSLLQQFGIVGPKALMKATSEYLTSFDKNPEEYIDEPVYTANPLTLFQEIQFCGQGEVPPMSMRDNHTVKAQMLINYMQEPVYMESKVKGIYVPSVDEKMMLTIQKHFKLAELLEPTKMTNPTGNNNQSSTQLQTGTAPQQGGQNPEVTTSRGGEDEGAMGRESVSTVPQ